MPGGRICRLCADGRVMELAAQLIAAGHPDLYVAKQLGLTGEAGRMVVSRHRRNHVESVARVLAEAASKGRTNVVEREQAITAAQSGDAVASFLALDKITSDLRNIHTRLERVVDGAEADGQRSAVAQLSTAQLRSVEVRSRLGSAGGYATPRAGAATGVPFNLTINFVGQRPLKIEGTALPPGDPMRDAPTPTFASIDAPDHAPERRSILGDDHEEDLIDGDV